MVGQGPRRRAPGPYEPRRRQAAPTPAAKPPTHLHGAVALHEPRGLGGLAPVACKGSVGVGEPAAGAECLRCEAPPCGLLLASTARCATSRPSAPCSTPPAGCCGMPPDASRASFERSSGSCSGWMDGVVAARGLCAHMHLQPHTFKRCRQPGRRRPSGRTCAALRFHHTAMEACRRGGWVPPAVIGRWLPLWQPERSSRVGGPPVRRRRRRLGVAPQLFPSGLAAA